MCPGSSRTNSDRYGEGRDWKEECKQGGLGNGETRQSLHPEAEEATGKAETELEAAALQQDRPSPLHHNLNC